MKYVSWEAGGLIRSDEKERRLQRVGQYCTQCGGYYVKKIVLIAKPVLFFFSKPETVFLNIKTGFKFISNYCLKFKAILYQTIDRILKKCHLPNK